MLHYYNRPVGVICFETDLLESEARLPTILNQLLATNLHWQWSSSRRYSARPDLACLNLPAQRDITRLLPENLNTILADLTEYDTNDDRRSLELIGADIDLTTTLQTEGVSKHALAGFAKELPPIRLVLVYPGDTGSTYIFLPHQPVASVATLMNAWDITIDRATRCFPYRRLRLARFEALFNLE